MHGCGHERPRTGHGFERRTDVRRVERPLGDDAEPAVHRKEHGGFEPVHVLGRHGADDRHAGAASRSRLASSAVLLFVSTPHVFGCGMGCRGRSRGEYDRRDPVTGNARHRVRRGEAPPGSSGNMHRVRGRMFRLVDETVSVGMQPLHLPDEFRRVVRRQQRDLSPQERSGERRRRSDSDRRTG